MLKSLWPFIALGLVVIAGGAFWARRSRWRDRAGQITLALSLLELGLLFIWMALDLEVSPFLDSDPRLVPIFWAGALGLFAAYQLIRIFRMETGADPRTGRIDKVLLTVAVVGACIYAIEFVGFYLASGAMIVLMLLLLGVRNPKPIVIMPVGWALFSWLVFGKLLMLGLPAGKLFS